MADTKAQAAQAVVNSIRTGERMASKYAEPHLADDVVFGIRGSGFLGERFGDQLLDAWEQGRPTLRIPLPDAPALAGSTR